VWAPAAAALAFLLPDRLGFVAAGGASRPPWFAALGAGALAVLAAGYVRALGFRGAAAFAAMAAGVLGGTLGLLADARTSLLCVLTAAIGWASVALARRRPALRPLAVGIAALAAPIVAIASNVTGVAPLSLLRVADLGNALVALAPIAAAAVPLVASSGPRRAPVAAVIGAFSLPLVALALFAVPATDVPRHLDRLAPVAVTLGFAAAWLVGETLHARPSARWLAVPVAGTALVGTLGWLWLQHDAVRGRAWVERFGESGARPASARAAAWEHLGRRAVIEDRWRDAAVAWERVAALDPSPRALALAGIAAELGGRPERARALYLRTLAIEPDHPLARRAIERDGSQAPDPSLARQAVLPVEDGSANH
jgi:hypothetical protein